MFLLIHLLPPLVMCWKSLKSFELASNQGMPTATRNSVNRVAGDREFQRGISLFIVLNRSTTESLARFCWNQSKSSACLSAIHSWRRPVKVTGSSGMTLIRLSISDCKTSSICTQVYISPECGTQSCRMYFRMVACCSNKLSISVARARPVKQRNSVSAIKRYAGLPPAEK